MPRPRPRALGALVLGAVVYAYGATSEVAWLFLAAYLCWALTAVTFAYAAWNARGLSVSVRLAAVTPSITSPVGFLTESVLRRGPVLPVFEGDRARVELTVASGGRPAGPVRLSGRVGDQAFEAGIGRVLGEAAVGIDLAALRRGRLAATVRAEAGDPAGLWRVPLRVAQTEIAPVLPRFDDLTPVERPLELEAAAPAPRAGSGLEIFGVREYRRGDSLRRIHWRTSARHGELVVREFEPPGRRLLLVALDPAPPAGTADQLARLAASEAWSCVERGGRAGAWSGQADLLPQATIWPILEWLAGYPESGAPTAPIRAGEVVAITAAGRGAAVDAAADAARRGGDARAWLVGEAGPGDPSLPARRAGLEWPI